MGLSNSLSTVFCRVKEKLGNISIFGQGFRIVKDILIENKLIKETP